MLQAVTAAFGNTIITGTMVNMLLILSVMTCGMMWGISVAILSPILAKLIGIGPFWSLIPFIVASNVTLVVLWHLTGNRNWRYRHALCMTTLITAAIAKFLVLYIGIVRIAIPVLLGLPESQSAVLSGIFSIPQLVTALLGGAALIVLPPLRKVLTKEIDYNEHAKCSIYRFQRLFTYTAGVSHRHQEAKLWRARRQMSFCSGFNHIRLEPFFAIYAYEM